MQDFRRAPLTAKCQQQTFFDPPAVWKRCNSLVLSVSSVEPRAVRFQPAAQMKHKEFSHIHIQRESSHKMIPLQADTSPRGSHTHTHTDAQRRTQMQTHTHLLLDNCGDPHWHNPLPINSRTGLQSTHPWCRTPLTHRHKESFCTCLVCVVFTAVNAQCCFSKFRFMVHQPVVQAGGDFLRAGCELEEKAAASLWFYLKQPDVGWFLGATDLHCSNTAVCRIPCCCQCLPPSTCPVVDPWIHHIQLSLQNQTLWGCWKTVIQSRDHTNHKDIILTLTK